MDLRKLKTLIDLVSESNVSELEITEAEGKVRIVKGGGAVMQQYIPMAQPSQVAPMPQPAVADAAPLVAAAPEEVGHTVKSPMVGTFYRSARLQVVCGDWRRGQGGGHIVHHRGHEDS